LLFESEKCEDPYLEARSLSILSQLLFAAKSTLRPAVPH